MTNSAHEAERSAAQVALASASPRRLALLRGIGLRVLLCPADVDEAQGVGEPAEQYVRRVALAKLHAVRRSGAAPRHLPVLAADTAVVVDGDVLGKPGDRAAGLAMLARLSARTHQVLTAVAVGHGAQELQAVSVTQVTFNAISAAVAAQYWATGEPHDKAGGYGIQGIGGIFAARIEGSFTGVMGLPVAEVEVLLRRVGVATWENR
jgi:septum formation protein